MITPAYQITATERVRPRLALDFTTASLDPRVTFARSGNTATVTDNTGTIVGINADLPRFDFDPSTLACRGMLVELPSTNLLLNSLIDGTSLSTQSVTTTAAVHTLSFYGSGSVALSGTHSATVNGTGAYPARQTYSFTPTAGSLTLTVTGTVQFAQLEALAFATSFIPTDGTTKTRNADFASMTGTNFSDWFNNVEGTFFAQARRYATTAQYWQVFHVNNNTDTTRISCGISNDGLGNSAYAIVSNAGATQAQFLGPVVGQVDARMALAYKANSFAFAANGGTIYTDNTGVVPTCDRLFFYRPSSPNQFLNGWIQKLFFWPQRLINAEVQAFSK